jgi:hypothetical protein
MAQTGFTPIQLYYSSTTTNVPLAANLATGELAINITDGKLFYKDNAAVVQVIGWKTVPTSAGGTGLTSYTAGDTVYYASGTTLSKLAIGASGRYLSSTGSAPQWSAPAALTKTDDTNVTLTLGGSASTALLNAASLTLGWTGTLATTRGGTGLSSFTNKGIVYASSTSALATSSALTFDGTNLATTGTINGVQIASTLFNVAAGATATVTISNVLYGSGTINFGGYASAGQGYFSRSLVIGGFQGGVTLYDVTTLVSASSALIVLGAVTKNTNDVTFTIQNNGVTTLQSAYYSTYCGQAGSVTVTIT